MEKKICRPNFDSVLYNFVKYGTVQYRVPPPHKSEIFFLCISGGIRPFPMFSQSLKEKPPKKTKKFGIGQDPPPPPDWKIPNFFWIFF